MHPVATAMNWSHHLHDSMPVIWHEIDQHLHSRHFWAGVTVTLLIICTFILLLMLAKNAPIQTEPMTEIPWLPHTLFQ